MILRMVWSWVRKPSSLPLLEEWCLINDDEAEPRRPLCVIELRYFVCASIRSSNVQPGLAIAACSWSQLASMTSKRM